MSVIRLSKGPNPRTVLALRILWALLIMGCEYATFAWTASQCPWPSLTSTTSRILIVADPQILDHGSYPDRGVILTFLSRVFTDLNLRRSWRAALRKQPDAVVFLGDMMDNGRVNMSDDEYERYYARFNNIFAQDKSTPRYFVPGNHDTGIGAAKMFSPEAHNRYFKHFGPPNHIQNMSGYTLVFVDAPSLVEEEYERTAKAIQFNQWTPVKGGPVEFIHGFHKNRTDSPVILFTHIPLARPEGVYCGPLRERGTIHRGGGIGYQNTLGQQMSHFILDQVRPSLIFSGDDHDYCEYTHTLDDSTRIREVTVKSLSMAMGIRRPGFQLLSLAAPSSAPVKTVTHADAPCLMPDQLGIYLSVYLPLIAASLLVLLVLNVFGSSYPPRRSSNASLTRIASRPRSDLDGSDDDLPKPSTVAKRRHQGFVLRVQSRLWRGWRLRTFAPRSGLGGATRRWWLAGFVSDVWDVAVVPIGLFSVLAVYTLWS
ncbi:hypothetical protein EYR40_006518 [Pleurotus pulmonarius]|nr:hypothetical protein EYR36_011137 [Pleurotus pulmonarius]KAF4599424.1 hypothetical protein EYR40_006518 [Pleurotus pulmonarius]